MDMLTIPITKKEKVRLHRVALRYGLSLPEFSRHILEEISLHVPEESIEGYEHPKKILASFKKSLSEYSHRNLDSAKLF